MKASETSLRILLEGQKQFQIPLFQRPYGWREGNWEALWADILETYESEAEATHFLGPIVTKSLPGTPEGVSPFLVIDGQQRLTSLVVLLAAMRDAFAPSNAQLAKKLDELFIGNRFVPGFAKYKVLPTQADRGAFFSVVDGTGTSGPSPIHRLYRFFMSRLNAAQPASKDIDAARLEHAVLSRLQVVSVTLGQDDNEFRIFESLNAKGMPLRQVDLLKNYVFMRLPAERQEPLYASLWRPMEDVLGDALESFFRHEFISSGEFVREGDVYQGWKSRLDPLSSDEIVERLHYFSTRAGLYARLVKPELEPDKTVAARLVRLRRWGGQTIYPFLLTALQKSSDGDLQPGEMADLLRILESYLVRRLFVGVPTNALNRLFTRLAYQLPQEAEFVAGVRHVLSLPSRRWPRDTEFQAGLLRYPLYTDSRAEQRKLILEAFETDHQHKEAPPLKDLTVEHVLPQTLTPEWRLELGVDADDIHRRLLHVLGNLTLTGYNSELSNSPWAVKRELLRASNIDMNKELAASPSWGQEQILRRGTELSARALVLWPGPDHLTEADEPDDVQLDEGALTTFYLGCIERVASHIHLELTRVTDTLFASGDGSCAVACLISKAYRDGTSYWWTFRSRHEQALAAAQVSYLALGCGSPSQTLLIKFADWKPILATLNSTIHGKQTNWHVQIRQNDDRLLLHRKGSLPALDVTDYLLDTSEAPGQTSAGVT